MKKIVTILCLLFSLSLGIGQNLVTFQNGKWVQEKEGQEIYRLSDPAILDTIYPDIDIYKLDSPIEILVGDLRGKTVEFQPGNSLTLETKGNLITVKMIQIPDSIKIPKSLIEQISSYLPPKQELNINGNPITNPIDLSQVRTAGMFALSIPGGGLGRQLLIQLQNSPYDEKYLNKGLLVGQSFYAEIRTNLNGDQVIVFKRK